MTFAHPENDKGAQKEKMNNHSRKPQVFTCEREKAPERLTHHHGGHGERGYDAAQNRVTKVCDKRVGVKDKTRQKEHEQNNRDAGADQLPPAVKRQGVFH